MDRKRVKEIFPKPDHPIELISKTPKIFPESYEKKEIRKAVIEKHNSLYYRIIENLIEIVSSFSNLKNPDNKKL